MNAPRWLVVPQPGQPPVESDADGVYQGLADGRLSPTAQVSSDGGRIWLPAPQALQRARLAGHNDAMVGYVVPGRVEPNALIAGYIALFSLLFFGGPMAVLAAVIGWDDGKMKLGVKLALIAGAFALGPAPIALLCRGAGRKLRQDPTLDGRGRMIFAAVVAVLMTVPILVGVLGALVRAAG